MWSTTKWPNFFTEKPQRMQSIWPTFSNKKHNSRSFSVVVDLPNTISFSFVCSFVSFFFAHNNETHTDKKSNEKKVHLWYCFWQLKTFLLSEKHEIEHLHSQDMRGCMKGKVEMAVSFCLKTLQTVVIIFWTRKQPEVRFSLEPRKMKYSIFRCKLSNYLLNL